VVTSGECQLIGAIRLVRREVPGAAEIVAEQCSAHDDDDPGNRLVDDGRRRALGANVGNECSDGGMFAGGVVQVGLSASDTENVRSGPGKGDRGSLADPDPAPVTITTRSARRWLGTFMPNLSF
jgi:hypothetical protein